jgi:aminopeptidase N
MSRSTRPFGVWFIAAASFVNATAWAQNPGPGASSAKARRPFARPGTPPRAERIRFFDVKHIKAELTIDTKKREVRGRVTHTLSPLHPYLGQLELDCGPELVVTKVALGAKLTPCEFTAKDEKLSVKLEEAYGPADTIDLAIDYHGSPQRGLYFVLPEAPYPKKRLSFWTQGESDDTHCWIPCYDYPNERATSEMIITADKPLFVLSNGVLVDTKDNGETTTYHWKMNVPHVSYLISLAASDFAVYHDQAGKLPLDYYVAKHVDEATARRFMGKTPQMIRFFDEKIGQPYPYEKYAQVCVPDFIAGGMENISATTMTESALHDEIAELEGNADGLVAHELAHQWFGDLLTCKDWSHVWLNEGFASYFDPLFTEHARGEDAFRLEMNGSLKGYLAGDQEYRRPIVERRYESSMDMFDGVTYSKGACVLHALRGLLGDQAWWKGTRQYVAAHKFQIVETDDFRRAMEAASGKDLKWFFDQWVYKAGHPELKVRWHYEDADRTVRVKVQQTQALDDQTPLFRLPTTLEITEEAGKTRTVPIVVDGASHEFVIPSAAKPRMVQIDPLGWLPKTLDFEKSDEENLFQLAHAGCVLGRMDAAAALARNAMNKPDVAKAVASAWKREKAAQAKLGIFEHLCNGQESLRADLVDAARDPEARIRVAAISGLARLKKDDVSETILRAAWSNPREAYGARKAALRGLVGWKVKDAESLLADGLKNTADNHSIAAASLQLMLEKPGALARELAAIHTRYGQPGSLRSTAIGAFSQLAKDDPALQDILVDLVDDADRSVRFQAWTAVRDLRLKKALPRLRARLASESRGFSGFTRRILEQAIDTLKQPAGQSQGDHPAVADDARSIAELEGQAVDLEKKSQELRSRIAALKLKAEKAAVDPRAPAGTAASTGSH